MAPPRGVPRDADHLAARQPEAKRQRPSGAAREPARPVSDLDAALAWVTVLPFVLRYDYHVNHLYVFEQLKLTLRPL